AVRETLVPGWRRVRGPHPPLEAALGHAVDFRAWLSMADQGLDDAGAIEIMLAAVTAAAAQRSRRPSS
ncbi:MAG: hypothetical protein ACLGHP_11140, partial [Vicinamibacteria bacterium]